MNRSQPSTTEQNEILRLGKRLKDILKTDGPISVLQQGLDKVSVYSQYKMRKSQFANQTFKLFDQTIPYFIHHYNATWRNERCVEIAAAFHYLKQWDSNKILELGNVMSYYGPHQYTVVDKYEKSPGVDNSDFLTYKANQPFDGFISISTFEHIGWDEAQKSKEKLLNCFNNIEQQVSNKAQVLVTVPLGYNSYLDELAKEDLLPFAKMEYLIRTSKDQTWESVPLSRALDPGWAYGKQYDGANALLVGLGLK